MDTIEKDILTEIFNISLAKAADSFAKILHEDVLINVPAIALMEEESALTQIIQKKQIDLIVQSEIKGDIYGQTLLLFSRSHLQSLAVNALKDDKIDREELETSFLLELSNILTGTLVTHLANILKLNIYGSVPNNPIDKNALKPEHLTLDLEISKPILVTINTLFVKRNSSIELPLMLILDIKNLNKVLEIIRKINANDKLLLRK